MSTISSLTEKITIRNDDPNRLIYVNWTLPNDGKARVVRFGEHTSFSINPHIIALGNIPYIQVQPLSFEDSELGWIGMKKLNIFLSNMGHSEKTLNLFLKGAPPQTHDFYSSKRQESTELSGQSRKRAFEELDTQPTHSKKARKEDFLPSLLEVPSITFSSFLNSSIEFVLTNKDPDTTLAISWLFPKDNRAREARYQDTITFSSKAFACFPEQFHNERIIQANYWGLEQPGSLPLGSSSHFLTVASFRDLLLHEIKTHLTHNRDMPRKINLVLEAATIPGQPPILKMSPFPIIPEEFDKYFFPNESSLCEATLDKDLPPYVPLLDSDLPPCDAFSLEFLD